MITDFSRGSILHIVGTVALTDLKICMTKTVLYLLLLHFDSNLRRMFSLTCTIKWRENFVYSFTCSDQLIFWLLLSAVKFASFPLSHLFGVIEHYLWFFKVIFNFLESERFPVTPYNRYLLTERLCVLFLPSKNSLHLWYETKNSYSSLRIGVSLPLLLPLLVDNEVFLNTYSKCSSFSWW